MGEPEKNHKESWEQEIENFDRQAKTEDNQWRKYTIPVGVQFDDYPLPSPTIAVNCYSRHHWDRMCELESGRSRVVTIYRDGKWVNMMGTKELYGS